MPWKIIAYKVLDSRSESMKYERMLKNLHSRMKVMDFITHHKFNKVAV